MEPAKFNSAYNSTISVKPQNLDNISTSFVLETNENEGLNIPQNYVAITDNVINDKLDNGFITNIEMAKSLDTRKIQENFESSSLHYQTIQQTGPDIITKFYIGSMTIVGLYIFYRIMVKNK